jgi:uncharacterized protein (TIGR00290 family)
MTPRILVAWSSGKDSAWCLHALRREGAAEIAGLLTAVNGAFGRAAMHGVRRDLVRAQAEAAGLPLREVPLPHPCPEAAYAAAMAAAMREARAEGITHVAFGDLCLADVRRYREERLRGTGIAPLFPLWGRDTGALAREMIAGGLRARITCLDPRKLPASFAGRAFDAALLADLPAGVDPCGENGEFHTFAHDGPIFRRPVAVRTGGTVERDGFVFADLIRADATCPPSA